MNLKKITLAIKGLGVVGQARLRALQELPQFELAAVCSRRVHLQSMSWEKVLSSDWIEAVAISTENTNHYLAVRDALEAGKHVLCDYPLAFSIQKIEELTELAQKNQKILHVEHIALLTSEHIWMKNQIGQMGKLMNGSYEFTAAFSDKIADEKRQGPLVFLTEARLLQIADWFSEVPSLHDLALEIKEDSFLFKAKLCFSNGGFIQFQERRAPQLARKRSITLQMEKGSLEWPNFNDKGGLFKKDLEVFAEKIRGKKCEYYNFEHLKMIIEELSRVEV